MEEIFVCAVDASRLDAADPRHAAAVSPERAERMAALRHAADRRRSLGAELALNGALRNCVPGYRPPPRYRYLEGGKPELTCADWHISLAHAGDWAICAASRAPVGIDIERADRISPLPVWDWVGVESYLKLTGAGLSGKFRELRAGEDAVFLGGDRVAHLARAAFRGYLICAASHAPIRMTIREC